jgi:hypothetical protein
VFKLILDVEINAAINLINMAKTNSNTKVKPISFITVISTKAPISTNNIISENTHIFANFEVSLNDKTG